MRGTIATGCIALGLALSIGVARSAIYEVPSEYPTIQQGIDASSPGDTVQVSPGTYAGSGNRALDFGGKDLVLLSVAGAAETIIDCGLSARGLHLHTGETRAARIEGFTFRNGAVSNGYGAAAFFDGASPAIRDCAFEDSRHSGSNGAGGGVCFRNSAALMDRCVVVGCTTTGFGGGIACRGTISPTILECGVVGNFSGSGGGGIDCGGIGAPRIADCEVAGNSAGGVGGGILLGGAASVEGCRIAGNDAGGDGGGVYCAAGGSAATLGCTVAGNHAGGDGGGLAAFGTVAIARTVLWGNCSDGIGDQGIAGDGGRATIACSITDSMEWVELGGEIEYLDGVVGLDPLFCGPLPCEAAPATGGDYRIDRSSPALPEGNPCGTWIGSEEVGCPAAGAEEAEEAEEAEKGATAIAGRLLHRVYPNPSRGAVVCDIRLPVRSRIRLEIFDLQGRVCGGPFEGVLPAGSSVLEIDPAGRGGPLSAGAYILRLDADRCGVESRSVVLIR